MKRSILKNLIRDCLNESKSESEYDLQYVTYLRQMNGEVPFMMGGKKFEYVWAKYPSGKRDIGVYAFSGDVVHGYNYFRKMYNLDGRPGDGPVNNDALMKESSVKPTGKKTHFFVNREDLSRGSRDQDAEREIVYQIVRVTSDPSGDDYEEVNVGGDYYDEGKAKAVAAELNQKLAGGQITEDTEHFSKTVKGTVNVNGEEFDYEATVSGNVVGTPQAHGEFHSEVDESSIDIDIKNVKPYPEDERWKAIDSAVYDDVMGKNLWDLVNERSLKEFEGEANKDVCIKCKREILPSETRHRMPMSGLCQHMPSCPTDPPMGEKPHDRDVRLGKLKEIDGEPTKSKKVEIVLEKKEFLNLKQR